jgi:putative endonuclease
VEVTSNAATDFLLADGLTRRKLASTMKDVFVYILTNDRCTTLYIGVTNNLESRVWQHQNGEGSKFAKKYNLGRLVYYEVYPYPAAGIAREKQLKGWNRAKKETLIATTNPEWRDLSMELFGADSLVVRRGSSTPLHSAQNDFAERRRC